MTDPTRDGGEGGDARFADPGFDWTGPSADPEDEQFGDRVERTTPTDAGEYDAVLVGEPYDGAVVGRAGASEGPRALRGALASVKTHHFAVGGVDRVADLGDVAIPEGTVRGVQSAVRDAADAAYDTGALPVFLGGDNSLTYGNVGPLLGRDVGVLNFDAHLDVRSVRDEPTSGTPYRQLFGAGLDGYACVGARHFETSTAYAEFVRDRGGSVVTAERAASDPVGAVEHALETMADVEAVYVSVDLDVLDAAHAPGVSAPTPGGLTTRELFRMVRQAMHDHRVAGFEVVECAPPLDRGAMTASAGARVVAHALAGRTGVTG